MIIYGHLVVHPEQREAHLAGCVTAVEQAHRAPGCLDSAGTADLVDPGRTDVFERWASQADVEAFRASGPSEDHGSATLPSSVSEHDVADVRSMT